MGLKGAFTAKKLKNIREAFVDQLPSKLEMIKESYAVLGQENPTKEALRGGFFRGFGSV
jgi:hypothetical protein